MKHHRLGTLRTVVTGLAALLIVGTSAATSASAATPTYWTYESQYNGGCLTASASTTTVFTIACQGWQAQDWDWVGSANFWGQHQLMSRTRGLCLTTNEDSDRNGIWLSSCDARDGQYWDNDIPDTLNDDDSLARW